uniref:PGG domain-containing protein n=1 Tax=Triticum urartu TaxID=4572 RepID=A0A8R7VBC8_TRIUA
MMPEKLLEHCPDAPYLEPDGSTLLHTAVSLDHPEFVEFVLRTPILRKLVNVQDHNGSTALHLAVRRCNPRVVTALLSHVDIDLTLLDDICNTAAWELSKISLNAKTLNWNEVAMLMSKAKPHDAPVLHNLHIRVKRRTTDASRQDAKSLTQTYTSNTSLVAILIATITFAAAFTLPGGYSNDAGSEGLPIMSRKFAFQAFLISDVLAMCSSFAVAFICIIAKWEDYEFLVYYRSFTKKLMWFAYVTTTTAFSTGLYTVLAPGVHWLAIAICLMVALLPILTKLLGEWPILKLRLKLGKDFNSDFLDMV